MLPEVSRKIERIILMIALKDEDFIEEVHKDVSTVRGKVFTPFLFAYPLLFVPFNDIVIVDSRRYRSSCTNYKIVSFIYEFFNKS